jgi:hypothetical protein
MEILIFLKRRNFCCCAIGIYQDPLNGFTVSSNAEYSLFCNFYVQGNECSDLPLRQKEMPNDYPTHVESRIDSTPPLKSATISSVRFSVLPHS